MDGIAKPMRCRGLVAAVLHAALIGWVVSTPWELSTYELCREAELDGIPNEASGVTWSPVTNSFWVITRRPQAIISYSVEGKKLKEIGHYSLRDPEGITWIEGYTFAITEEIGPSITVVAALPWEAKVRILKEYDLSVIRSDRKKGLEGIAYDPLHKMLYSCQEQDPMKVWQIASDGAARQILNGLTKFDMRDLSGMYFKPNDNGIYILSQQSNRVLKYNFDGEVVDRKDAVEGRQAEGVTFTPDGQLMIIVGEPNYLWYYTSTGNCFIDPDYDPDAVVEQALLEPEEEAEAEEEQEAVPHNMGPYVDIVTLNDQKQEGFKAMISLAFPGDLEMTALSKIYLRSALAKVAFGSSSGFPHIIIKVAGYYSPELVEYYSHAVLEGESIDNQQEDNDGTLVVTFEMLGDTAFHAIGLLTAAFKGVVDKEYAETLSDLGVEYANKNKITVVGQATAPSGSSPQDYPFTETTAASLASVSNHPIIVVYDVEATSTSSSWHSSLLGIGCLAAGVAVAVGLVVLVGVLAIRRQRFQANSREPGPTEKDVESHNSSISSETNTPPQTPRGVSMDLRGTDLEPLTPQLARRSDGSVSFPNKQRSSRLSISKEAPSSPTSPMCDFELAALPPGPERSE